MSKMKSKHSQNCIRNIVDHPCNTAKPHPCEPALDWVYPNMPRKHCACLCSWSTVHHTWLAQHDPIYHVKRAVRGPRSVPCLVGHMLMGAWAMRIAGRMCLRAMPCTCTRSWVGFGSVLLVLVCSWTCTGSSLRFFGTWTLYFGPN